MANDDKQNRSLLLCQLINDRQIDKEVGAAIRKLLIEGVDINIQDSNRNNNTPLHLATQKSDKNCVSFLIKYKPDLQIRNSNDETAFDVAQSDEVREWLSSASFDVVEKKFVREIEFQNLSLERLKCLETDPAFKVLKITRCPTANIVWEILSQDDFNDAINKSSHLFVIAIETQEDEIEKLLAPSVDTKRPIIVQITSSVTSNKSLIYYKEEDSKQLIEVKFNSTIDKEVFLEKIQLKAFCNFASLVRALHSNIFGAISGSLLDVKLNNDKNRSEIVNCFAESSALCHRFFKLFDENLTEEELNARATSALQFPGDQSLSALLDFSFDFKDEVKLSDAQKRILGFVESRNYNLLMLATECNNTDAVKTLLRFHFDLDHLTSGNHYASDLCWMNQNWEILAELVAADSPYPKNFDASFPSLATSIAFVKIKSTTKAAAAFHECIRRGDIEEVKQFIKNNPKLKHVYDLSNKSALTVALEYDDAETYSLLTSVLFTPGVDDKYKEALENCNVKDEIRNKNREYFKNAFDEPHIVRLLNKSKLSFSSTTNREACSQVIQNMFLTLNEIPEMVPILQIVSCSELLSIVFDFDCHSVQEMDPTKDSSTEGTSYHLIGFIYIGAKNHREGFFEVIGTLAHELTHYAMELTYENNCKPYANNDEENQDIFKSIVNETRDLDSARASKRDNQGALIQAVSNDPIVSIVFSYNQEVWPQELIVRVPHLMASYKNASETLEEARSKNFRLFDYFRLKVLTDVKAQTKVLLHKLEMKKINSLTGTIEKIKKHELQLKKCEIKLEDQIFGSNAPQLTLGLLRQSLDESSHVFINIEQIAFGNILERIRKLEKKDFAIVVDCSEMVQKHAETICNVREMFRTSGNIFLVMADDETSIVTAKLTNFRVTHEHHNWSDLTDESQDILLQKNVIFQGTSCKLNELTSRDSAALLDLPLNEFCKSENFMIGDPLSGPFHRFYLPRNFITRVPKKINKKDQLENGPGTSDVATNPYSKLQIEKRKFKAGLRKLEGVIESEKFETVDKSLNEILVESKSTTVVIISDSAGTGKTSTLHEIARHLRENEPFLDDDDENKPTTRWTLLTDLKQHIEMFKKTQKDFKSFQDFVTKIILNGKSIFEKAFFAQFHQEGRTNILLDGFDEISPHYKKEVLKSLKLFAPKSGNQLWVTTRSHLELELEKTLDQLSCSLQPLTREAQIEFLEEVWKTDTNSSAASIQQNIPSIVEGLVDKLSSICGSKSSFIGLPILISIIAEIYGDPEKRNKIQAENLSFHSIFKQFVGKKVDISNEKGQIADLERIEILKQSEGVVEVHRKIAIAHFFGDEIADVDADYDDEEWTVEKLTRFGLIRYDESKGSLSFIHETFAEYFLADFIVGNLRTKAKACGAVKLLVKVLTAKDFQVVRLFLDQAVKELNFIGNEKLSEAVGKQLNVLGKEAFGILLHISKESREEVLKFMLTSIEHVEEQMLLISEKDEGGNNALLINIAASSKTMMQTLLDCITQNKNLQITKETLRALNNERRNVFHLVARNKHEEIFPTLCESMKKILTADEIKKMLKGKTSRECSVLQLTAGYCSENTINEANKIFKELFSDGEMKEMLFEVDKEGDTCLLEAVYENNKIAIKSFFKQLNVVLNPEELKKLIQLKGHQQKNIFHLTCHNKNEEILSTLHESIRPILTTDEIKQMLSEKDQNEWNILQYAAACCKENALNDLMKILKGLFSNEEMKEMLFEVNKNGDHSLHVASRLSNKILLKSFFKHFSVILNHDETKKLVQQRGPKERNIFQSACSNVNEEIFSTLHESMQSILTAEEIKKLLREKNQGEYNILHYAAVFCNESALDDLMKILRELFSNEKVKEMLFEVNKNSENIFYVAVRLSNKNALKSFFNHLNAILNHDETKKLIQQRGFEQRNIFQFACLNKNEEIFSTLHESMQPILATDEIKEMLREKTQNDWNILHFAAQFENAPDDLLKILRELFSNEKVKEMLFEVNKDGDHSLHLAARLSNKNALKSFFKHLNAILNPEETKKLIYQRGHLQRNIFHSACINKNEEIFSTLHEFMQPILTTEEIKKMLSGKERNEWNVLKFAAALCSEKTLNEVMKIFKELFSDEEMKEMLCAVDKDGENSLHASAGWNNKIAIKSFFKHLNVILNPEETRKLIQKRGFQKENIFQFACRNKNGEIFSTLHESMQPILTTDEIKEMLRGKTSNEWNILHYAAEFCNENTLNDLMKILKGLLSNEEMKAMLFEVSKYGENSLHVAARMNNKIAIKSFFKHLNAILNYEETKTLIQRRGFERRNIFYSACINENEEILSTLHEYAANFFENHEIKEMLSQKDVGGFNVLQFTESRNLNENAMNDLVKILKIHFSNEDIENEF